MMKTPGRDRCKEGFVLVTALLFSAVLFFAALLALREGMNIFAEKSAAARRLRAENAVMQASATAAAWLGHEISSSAGSDYFSLSSAPEANPLIDLPDSFFSALENIYPDHEFSCLTADLHYAPSFSQEAARLGIPLIPPRTSEDGSVTRYFLQKTSVSLRTHNTVSSITKIVSCTKNKNGEVSFRTENEKS